MKIWLRRTDPGSWVQAMADPLGPLGWHGGIQWNPGGLAVALLVVSWCEGSAHRGIKIRIMGLRIGFGDLGWESVDMAIGKMFSLILMSILYKV